MQRSIHLTTIFLVLFLSLASLPVFRHTLNNPPEPDTSDGIEYDSIAWQLAQGKGFSLNYDDPAFRRPYQSDPCQAYVLQRTGKGETAYRPPLLPFVMSGFFRIFGRVFAPIRIFNCFVVALGITLAFKIVRDRIGHLAATLTCLFLVIDSRTWFFSNKILTEGLAFFASVLLLSFLFKYQETRQKKWICLTATGLALGFFARSLFVCWAPAILLYFIYDGYFRTDTHLVTNIKHAILFGATFFLIVSPWLIRNCIILDRFAPLGTMSEMSMAAAYSDEAISNKGRWFNLADRNFFPNAPSDKYDTLEKEKRNSLYSQSVAKKWINSNLDKIPLLVAYRIMDTWKPETPRQTLLILFSFLGCFFYPKRCHIPIFIAIIIGNSLAVGLTWSVGSRFLFPILPVLAILAGGCVSNLFRMVDPNTNSASN